MSANNKTNKINKTSEWFFAILIIILVFLGFFLTSCQKEEPLRYSIIVLEQKDNTDIPDESAVVNITETNQTSVASIIPNQSEEREIIQNETVNESINETINEIINETVKEEQGQEQIPARANAVEFYFLLKGKSYFKYTLKEHELKAFDMSGTIIRIVPIFIANDSVVFKVDNYPTSAIGEKEWYSTPGFEIYVNYIYYRR
jgi:hypothetical protein